jgi:hypothetical protein
VRPRRGYNPTLTIIATSLTIAHGIAGTAPPAIERRRRG